VVDPSVERLLVDIGGAELEAHIGGVLDAGAKLVCASHPAGPFGQETVELLGSAAQARVVCVNPRGIGGSSPLAPAQRYTLEEIVDDIEAVRQRLDLGPWMFWGMSGGGWLAQIYARRHPRALTGIVVEAACSCFRERLADPACVLSPFHPSWRATLADAGLLSATSHAQPAPADDGEWIDVNGVGAVFRRRNGPALLVSPAPLAPEMRRAMPELWRFDSRAWLPTLRLPTLVLCGTADPVVPVAHARAVHEAIVGSAFVAVEGAGHVPTAERRPEVAAAVRSFLVAEI
jgi:pimeloyl-ACP methyl ester carboxylesterase